MKNTSVLVKQDAEKVVPKEVLAKSIVEISTAMRQLRASGLNRKGIIALVAHSTKLGHGTIETVLTALENLKRDYCN